MTSTTTTTTNNNNNNNKFPTRRYKDGDISEVKYKNFSQCQLPAHAVKKKDFNLKEKYCCVQCFHYMAAVSRACQYKNCLSGMLLYRGSKVHHETEICTFWRSDNRNDQIKYLQSFLLVANRLQDYYNMEENKNDEGARMFSFSGSLLTTIRILALIQHYGEVLNEKLSNSNYELRTATPMLDCTRDLRVAASFAIDGHGENLVENEQKQGVVRLLLVPAPRPIDLDSDTFWKTEGILPDNHDNSVYIQQLGETDMLLIDLTTILPASVVRPLNQSGYFIVKRDDLINFHNLRIDTERATKGTKLIDIIKADDFPGAKIQNYIESGEKWNALEECRIVDVRIGLDPSRTNDDFFHNIDAASNPFPMISHEHLYPKNTDPMRAVMEIIAEEITKKFEDDTTQSVKRKAE